MRNALVALTAVVVACSCIGSPGSGSNDVLPDVEAGLLGRWELVTTIENGGSPQATAGTFRAFRADHTFAADCTSAGTSWVLLADGRTLEYHNSLDIMFRETVIELTASTSAFREDVAEFHYERRGDCP